MISVDLTPQIAGTIKRAFDLATAHLQRPLTDKEAAMIVAAVFRYFDESDAPTTRLS
ncbi:hypothetical protein ABID08_003273 [Rhizobium binae]|uniref:Uncharacterized protein n=1 Tax=Rhizobium binae TaxID=1138190 RepID=A0ABV2MHF9_9HYPH|nr:hypothetical protein [Rhizobium binae]MBX4991406.1 hypothetical protein [Rhizobium binae]QSY81569.1 hypothetical protein J2J99_18230 [Rhizobium binae]